MKLHRAVPILNHPHIFHHAIAARSNEFHVFHGVHLKEFEGGYCPGARWYFITLTHPYGNTTRPETKPRQTCNKDPSRTHIHLKSYHAGCIVGQFIYLIVVVRQGLSRQRSRTGNILKALDLLDTFHSLLQVESPAVWGPMDLLARSFQTSSG